MSGQVDLRKSVNAEGSNPTGRGFGIIQPGEPHWWVILPPELINKDARNLEWEVEEGDDEYHLRPCEELE